MRSKSVLAFAVCFGAVVGFVAAGLIPWSPAQADEEEQSRLYVKCPKPAVQPIVDFVAERGGQVHDMDSFARLHASQRVPPLPPLQSSVAIIEAIYESLAAAKKDGYVLQVTALHARTRQFKFTVRVSSYDMVDTIRKALNSSPYLRSRMGPGGRIEMGSSARGRDGMITQDFHGALRQPVGDVKVPEIGPDTNIGVAEMDRIATKAGLRSMSAGAERRDVNRSAGVCTVSRDFTYEPTVLDSLRTFLEMD